MLKGDWGAAREFSDRANDMIYTDSSPTAHRSIFTRAYLECETGNMSEGDRFLDRYLEMTKSLSEDRLVSRAQVAACIPMLSRITGDNVHLDWEESVGRQLLSRKDNEEIVLTRRGLGLIAMLKNNAKAAA
jgi:hypothetical protein